MNARETFAEAERLAAERGWAPDSPQEGYLLSLLSAREDARHSLLNAVSALRGDLDRLDAILQKPSPLLNTLGELQARPAVIEAKAGEFAACDRAIREYLQAFPAKAED